MNIIENVTNTSKEKEFEKEKLHLKEKFQKLFNKKKQEVVTNNVKTVV